MNEPLCSVSPPLSSTDDNELRHPKSAALSPTRRRPTELPPSPSPVGPPSSDIDPLIGPPSPFANPEPDLTHLSPMSLGGEAYVRGEPATPKAWIAASMQTDPWSPTRRVRKQLFNPHLRTLKIVPSAPPPFPYDFGLRVDTRETRRHCDCASCVRHSLRLLRSDVREFRPPAPGIRFIHLPLQTAVSTAVERQQLDGILRERPQATYVACGCDRCGAHRDLLRAFREARRLTPPDDSSTANLEPPALH